MDAFATSAAGLQASAAQFETSASAVVRGRIADTPSSGAGAAQARNAAPLMLSDSDLAAGLAGQMMALVSYRANIQALSAADRIAKITIDLIG